MLEAYTPRVERSPWGILCLILNILPLPGLGTIIAGVRDGRHVGRDVVIGVVQLLLTIAILGFIWSVVWGVAIFVNSAPMGSGQRARQGPRAA
ncbi:MAG: hypothetical protein V4510_11400 [bacterium]